LFPNDDFNSSFQIYFNVIFRVQDAEACFILAARNYADKAAAVS
jgi:hypothetical protein